MLYPDVKVKNGGFDLGTKKGLKRKKFDQKDKSKINPKLNLNSAVHLALMRPNTKDDIVFTTTGSVEEGGFMAKVAIPGLSAKLFAGTKAPNKKEAEQSAAEAALNGLSS